MQKLHLVGFTTDQKSLILSARRGSRSGGFVIEVDADLATAVEALRARPAEADAERPEEPTPPRRQSALSVRELQARLRAGRSIEAVAADAGVDAEWVARFAPPVLAEQARVIDNARAAVLSRPRLGPSALPLGSAVYRNLVARGVAASAEELDRGWSSRQVAGGHWLVTFTYTSRGRRQQAVWVVDLRAGRVLAHDRLAAELAYVPGPPRPAGAVDVPPSRPTQAREERSDTDRATARRVSEARKLAETQLADAAKRGSKRSADAARRAARPGAGGSRRNARAVPERAVAALIEPTSPQTADTAPLAGTEAAVDAVAGVAVTGAADSHVDPAVQAVAAVREAAAALLQDFATGSLTGEPPVPRPLINRVGPAVAPEPEPVARPVAPPAAAVEEVGARPRFRHDLAAPAVRNGSDAETLTATARPAAEPAATPAVPAVPPPAPPPSQPRPRRTTRLRAR